MGYIKRGRSQVILASFLLFSVVVALFPAIDLGISRLFYQGGFPRDQWWQSFLHDSLNWFLGLSLGSVVAIYAVNRLLKRRWRARWTAWDWAGFAVLAIGAGLIVNFTLKDNFGRARPRDVAEFGGAKQFTPAFVISGECRTNCSFSSGDAAGGFFGLALAMALSRRRAVFGAAASVGVLVSVARIASGAHFFSDTVVSFFIMLIVADVSYFYMVMTAADRVEVGAVDAVLKPAAVVVPNEIP